MNQIDRLRIKRGVYLLHQIGPAATAELLAEVASRIGGLPCIVGCLTEFEHRNVRSVRSAENAISSKTDASR
jgi:hypothetical protein